MVLCKQCESLMREFAHWLDGLPYRPPEIVSHDISYFKSKIRTRIQECSGEVTQ